MPTVTVLAPDSALAMDEVIRQLGADAYILSTTTRDGQIEIRATNEPNQIQPPRKRTTSVSFSDALAEQVGQGAGLSAGFRSSRATLERTMDTAPQAQPAPTQGATVVSMETARARLTEAAPLAMAEGVTADTAPAAGTTISLSVDAPPEAAIAHRLRPAPSAAQVQPLVLSATMRKREADDPWGTIDPNPDSATAQTEPRHGSVPGEGAADLRPILHRLGAELAQLEAQLDQFEHQRDRAPAPVDPLVTAGFSAEIVQRLAPSPEIATAERAGPFAAALARTLVAADPMASLRAPVVVVVGPSGGGKTVLAGKIAALMVDLQPTRAVRLVSLSETPRFDNTALPLYARMVGVPHRGLQSDHLDTEQWRHTGQTHILDTNLDAESMQRVLRDLQARLGQDGTSLVVALPLGSSIGRIKAELEQYREFNPTIALTKLDECELTPQEASQIAETGTKIAWLSGTRALTETIAPASEEMMNEFLTGLLAVRS